MLMFLLRGTLACSTVPRRGMRLNLCNSSVEYAAINAPQVRHF
jgi:hypothetical protein